MNAMERNAEKLAADLKRIVRDSEDLLNAASESVGDKTEEMRSRLRNSVESAAHACQEIHQRALRGAREGDRLLRKHPYKSIGIALGLGLLIGAFLHTNKEP
jgi:ElaB/YqjD/DUF883 family membrane-anchored ribosome-binding protein